jgi:hypothetical protein
MWGIVQHDTLASDVIGHQRRLVLRPQGVFRTMLRWVVFVPYLAEYRRIPAPRRCSMPLLDPRRQCHGRDMFLVVEGARIAKIAQRAQPSQKVQALTLAEDLVENKSAFSGTGAARFRRGRTGGTDRPGVPARGGIRRRAGGAGRGPESRDRTKRK